jgi:hypothetical protein
VAIIEPDNNFNTQFEPGFSLVLVVHTCSGVNFHKLLAPSSEEKYGFWYFGVQMVKLLVLRVTRLIAHILVAEQLRLWCM